MSLIVFIQSNFNFWTSSTRKLWWERSEMNAVVGRCTWTLSCAWTLSGPVAVLWTMNIQGWLSVCNANVMQSVMCDSEIMWHGHIRGAMWNPYLWSRDFKMVDMIKTKCWCDGVPTRTWTQNSSVFSSYIFFPATLGRKKLTIVANGCGGLCDKINIPHDCEWICGKT